MIKEIVSAMSFFLPSFLTCFLFRLVGHKIGRNANISIFSYVYADEIDIGNDVDIRSLVFIRLKKFSIGNSSIISFGTQIKGEKNFLTKGSNFIGAHCIINCEEDVEIGFYSGLGPKCMVYTHGSFLPVTMGYPARFEKVILKDFVWIAMSVTILPGTHIESNCIINPGVILKSRVPSNSLIEVKPNVFSTINLSRLQTFLQKRTNDHTKNIIETFLTHYRIDFIKDESNHGFSVQKKYFFSYFPESEIIELRYGDKKITYDLKNFYTDHSTLKIHRKFLFYLRRRCGIILQIRYKN